MKKWRKKESGINNTLNKVEATINNWHNSTRKQKEETVLNRLPRAHWTYQIHARIHNGERRNSVVMRIAQSEFNCKTPCPLTEFHKYNEDRFKFNIP